MDSWRRCTGETPPSFSGRILIKPDHIPRWIAKPSRNLRRIRPDRLQDLPAVSYDSLKHCGHAIHHDVDQETWRGRWRPPQNPRPANLTDPVVERRATVSALPDVPAEDRAIETSRTRNIDRRNLEVTNLAVPERGRHYLRASAYI